MNKDFEALKPYLDKYMAMNTAMALFEWDAETLAPKAAVNQTAKILGVIAGEAYNSIMNDEVKQVVYKLSEEVKEGVDNGLTEVEKGIVKELKKNSYQLLNLLLNTLRSLQAIGQKPVRSYTMYCLMILRKDLIRRYLISSLTS